MGFHSSRSKYTIQGGKRYFSIKTGIPGLRYKHYYSRKNYNIIITMVVFGFMAFWYMIYFTILVVYNLVRFGWWLFMFVVGFVLIMYDKYKGDKPIENIIEDIEGIEFSNEKINKKNKEKKRNDFEQWKKENPGRTINDYYAWVRSRR